MTRQQLETLPVIPGFNRANEESSIVFKTWCTNWHIDGHPVPSSKDNRSGKPKHCDQIMWQLAFRLSKMDLHMEESRPWCESLDRGQALQHPLALMLTPLNSLSIECGADLWTSGAPLKNHGSESWLNCQKSREQREDLKRLKQKGVSFYFPAPCSYFQIQKSFTCVQVRQSQACDTSFKTWV